MWRIALVLVVLLAACSKDTGGGDSATIGDILEDVTVVSQLSNVIFQADTLILSDSISVRGENLPSLTQYTCDSDGCMKTNQADDTVIEPLVTEISDLSDLLADPRTTFSERDRRRGVGLAQHAVTATDENGAVWSFRNYAAWLGHSAFDNAIGTADVDGITLQAAYNVSFGAATGTNPKGSAQWVGVMLGNTRHGDVQALRGNATIDFDFTKDELDVAFTNIVNLDTNASQPAIVWPTITNVANGAFEFQGNGHIVGRFYGPDHAEVGGVFTYPTAVGAFGAGK